jgi:hypothetical protein
MRKTILIPVLAIFVSTLILWLFSILIQPLLPASLNNIIYIFGAALVGVITVLTGVPDIIDRISGKSQTEIDRSQNDRNRQSMLNLVWSLWVDGLLKSTLYQQILIPLELKDLSEPVPYPLDPRAQGSENETQVYVSASNILEVFEKVNSSLFIIGEPGSGKTTLLAELCRQAVIRARKVSSQPIPVIFNLSSWRPQRRLAEWLVDELVSRYHVPRRVAKAWVDQNELLILLDGLDEVKPEYRGLCISEINALYQQRGISLQLVVGSRKQEYLEAKTKLRLLGTMLIEPLSDQQVNRYLNHPGEGLSGLRKLIQRNVEIRKFARTPLVLKILVLTYKNASKEDLQAFEKAEDYWKVIFDRYIEEMFRRYQAGNRYSKSRTMHTLKWLAGKMVETGQASFSIENLQPDWLDTKRANMIYYLISRGLGGVLLAIPVLIMWIKAVNAPFTLIGTGLLGGMIFGYFQRRYLWKSRRERIRIVYPKFTRPGPALRKRKFVKLALVRVPKETIISFIAPIFASFLLGIFEVVFMMDRYTSAGVSSNGRLLESIVIIFSTVMLGGFVSVAFALFYGIRSLWQTKELDIRLPVSFSWSWKKSLRGAGTVFLILAFFILLNCGAVSVLTQTGLSTTLLIDALGLPLLGMILGGAYGGINYRVLRENQSPGNTLSRAFLNPLIFGTAVGIFLDLMFAYLSYKNIGILSGFITGLKYSLYGVFVVLWFGWVDLLQHLILRMLLRFSKNIPIDLIECLHSASKRILLSRLGGSYIFVHRMLMEHFSALAGENE